MSRVGKICAVAECRIDSRTKGISMHRFPKDPTLRKMWIRKSQRKDTFNAETSRICSSHFSPDDFERDMVAELMGTKPRAILKPNAIPSLYLRTKEKPTPPGVSKKNALVSKENRDEEQKVHEQEPTVFFFSSLGNVEQEETSEPEMGLVPFDVSNEDFKAMYENALTENLSLLDRNEALLAQNKLLQEKLDRAEKAKEEHLKVLNRVFTPNEIDLLMNRKKTVRWTAEEMNHAFTLRYLSKKAYIYLRETKGFPLPGISTLKRSLPPKEWTVSLCVDTDEDEEQST